MTMTIHVDIVSAETELYSGLVEMVFAPAIMGEVGIAPLHAPLVTRLKPGEVRLQLSDGKEESFFVSGGILEIQPHVVTILSDSASRTEDLDETAVLKAKEEAERAFHDRDGEIDFEHVQQQMVEARAKYEALQKLRGRSGRS